MADIKETVTTVTTTTTTTTTTVSGKKSGWAGLKTWLKVLIIALAVILLAVAAILIIFGRAHTKSNTMEDTYEANSTMAFKRFATPEKGDVVLFHHPEADSIVPSSPDKNYYKMCRLYGRAWCSKAEVVHQNKKKRPIYASRCVATPGDVVTIKDNVLYVNNNEVADAPDTKYQYVVVSNGYLNPSLLDTLGLDKDGMKGEEDYPEAYLGFYRNLAESNTNMAIYSLSADKADQMAKLQMVKSVQKVKLPAEHFEPTVFPYEENRHWNSTNFGPLLVPVKGKVIKLTVATLPLYRRCIEAYENGTVEVKGNTIIINGKEATSYKFKRNYYFVIGDNRASKDDSRYFGFLPDNHVVGVKF